MLSHKLNGTLFKVSGSDESMVQKKLILSSFEL